MSGLTDIYHYVNNDLSASATGDLQTATGTTRTQQRILRRLLTNPGDYIWEPDYGAGLPRYVGSVIDEREIAALIRGQVLLEDAVAATPEPTVTVTAIRGGISIDIQYTDSDSNSTATLSFNVTG